MERVRWIDFLRGLSMIVIIAFHTEVYYKQDGVTPYYIYTTNAILLFYFLSGYLFLHHDTFSLKRKLSSIIRSLLIPYFIFTTLLAIPKLLLYHQTADWQETILNIISGLASWFITALIVAEIIFSIILFISRGKHLWLSIISLLCFITYYLVPFNQHNYWQWQDALLAVPFLYLGYTFHHYESLINRFHKPLYSSLLLIVLILIKVYEYKLNLPTRNIAIEHVALFLSDAFITLLCMIGILRYIPHNYMIEWTGRHCIVYYFLCGGCPMIISRVLRYIGFTYDAYLYRYLLAFMLTYIFMTAITWIIYRYFPFLVLKNHE